VGTVQARPRAEQRKRVRREALGHGGEAGERWCGNTRHARTEAGKSCRQKTFRSRKEMYLRWIESVFATVTIPVAILLLVEISRDREVEIPDDPQV
jgi:hypothetical protein